MIQLNLLPDLKLEYIKAQRTQRLVLTVSVVITIASIALLVLLLGVSGLQKKHSNDLSQDISSETSKLQHEPQITTILTVQNQLNRLTALHAAGPAASRVFEFLNEVTPANVSINDFSIDFTKQTASITGTANNLTDVNKYIDTLKYTTYTSNTTSGKQPAFSNVVLSSFSVNTDSSTRQAANYTITLAYDKNIFDITQNVKLSVPNATTTRQDTTQPPELFQAAPANKGVTQ